MKTLDQIEPRRPISAPGFITEPGSYFLTGNATVEGDGISILSSDVSLDLSGFTITGDGSLNESGVSIGSVAVPLRNISVRNGKFFNFGSAISANFNGVNSLIIEDTQATSCTLAGIYISSVCSGVAIRRNVLTDCPDSLSIVAFSEQVINGVTIEGNTVTGGTSGVFLRATGGKVVNVTIRENHLTDQSVNAISVSAPPAEVQHVIIDSNHCSGNGAAIFLPADRKALMVRNFFVNLSLTGISTSGNTIGPLVPSTGTLGTSGAAISPWANLSN